MRAILLCAWAIVAGTCLASSLRTEDLLLRPLPNGHVMAHFQFESTVDELGIHHDTFPKSLVELIKKNYVEEMHIALTQGRWQYHEWGFPQVSAPPGAELWALFRNSTKDVSRAWKGLTQGMAGLFCASLQNLDVTLSTSPAMPFKVSGDQKANQDRLRYGSLASESVCTENLTPWTKLLACRSQAGLASLMNPERLFDSRYMSVALTVRPVCSGGGEHRTCATQVISTVTTVLQPLNLISWNLNSLFQRNGFTACPMADETRVSLEIPADREYSFIPLPDRIVDIGSGGGKLAIFENIKSLVWPFDVQVSLGTSLRYSRVPPPSVTATRYFTGHGHERGGLTVEITNHGASPVTVGYMDLLPWYLRVYFHTHRMTLRDAAGSERALSPAALHFYAARPAEDRVAPSVIELAADVPPATTLAMTLDFEKAFLRYTEFPQDAHRGFDVAPAMVTVFVRNGSLPASAAHCQAGLRAGLDWMPRRQAASNRETVVRIYTEPLLMSLPTPDFSMPYNVILFTCIELALFAGLSLSTMLRFLGPRVKPPPSYIERMYGRLKRLKKRLRENNNNASARPAAGGVANLKSGPRVPGSPGPRAAKIGSPRLGKVGTPALASARIVTPRVHSASFTTPRVASSSFATPRVSSATFTTPRIPNATVKLGSPKPSSAPTPSMPAATFSTPRIPAATIASPRMATVVPAGSPRTAAASVESPRIRYR